MSAVRLLTWPLSREVTAGSAVASCLKRVGSPGSSTQSPVTRRQLSAMACSKCVTLDNMNPQIKEMEYAVRGPIVIRAAQIAKELKEGKQKPFKEVVLANLGDCHAVGQIPITFIRQVISAAANPALLNDPNLPKDVKEHVKEILGNCRGGSVGSYTESAGIEIIRRHCAEYISRRDGGIPSDFNNIILSDGASNAIKAVLKLLICPVDGKQPGVMIPIPQYPLYTATIAEFNMGPIGYYLNEDENWSLRVEELERAIAEAKKTYHPRAIVVINPGNPTGQVLTRQNIEQIIQFAHKHNLFIFADEVYQDNIYASGSKFYSFKKVLTELGAPYNEMELASFMSCSKGYMGECGLRGGYTEVVNLDPDVKAMLFKCISAMLCPNVTGQVAIDCVVNPPKEGDPSYPLFHKEKTGVIASLKERAEMVTSTFNSVPGMSCTTVQGAMYAFPKIQIPQKAIDKAKSLGQEPSVFYAFQLLEQAGICIVPGSGFGQVEGTNHFRTTILPQPERLRSMLDTFKTFHEKFVKEYS